MLNVNMNSSSNNNGGNGSTPSNPHHHQNNHHHNSNNRNHQSRYYNKHGGSGYRHYNNYHSNQHYNHHNHHHNHQPHHRRNAPPQVFVSTDSGEYPCDPARQRGGGETTSNWSSSNLIDAGGDSSSTSATEQVSLNLSALKQSFYSPSPQNNSPAVSPSTTESGDAYSLPDDGTAGSAGTGSSSSTGIASSRHSNLSSNNNSDNGSTPSNHHQNNHHHNNNNRNHQSRYYNKHGGSGYRHYNNYHNNQHYNNHNHHHHQPHHRRNALPQRFVSTDTGEYPWAPARQRGGGETTSNWSSPNIVDAGGDSSSTSATEPISLNLSALKQSFYGSSPQTTSPAVSPSTKESGDAYSLPDNGTAGSAGTGSSSSTGIASSRHSNLSSNNLDTTIHYSTSAGTFLDPSLGSSLGNSGIAGYSYAQFHPHAGGFYNYPGAGHHHHIGGGAAGRTFSHHHLTHPQLINPNLGLLMPADSTYSMGKADSSINSSMSEKTLEWSDDGTSLTCSSTASSDRGDDFGSSTVSGTQFDTRCSTPDFYYAPYTITTPFTTANKKRFFNGSGTGKLSQAVQNQRFHHYPRKMYHLPGFPREWFDDLDPEEYVKAFSKFGEIKERPEALSQNPQSDSLSEGIWLKFVANQQTTDTFRKKMELWRDVYRIVRSLNCNSHFKHDPRNFPTFGLQVVGSTMSGFGSNTSDVDMCLLVRGSDVDQRYEAVEKLQVLYGALSATQWLDNVELIYAKVPILKFRDSKRSLEVDLNCNNYVGIRNTHLLYCYSQADWRLKPLVLVVKLWAHYHGINDAKNMTISSYSLVLMVIMFLQSGVEEPVLPILQQAYPEKFSNTSNILTVKINGTLPTWTSKNKETLGNLLIQFLKYYGKTFDYAENAVSVRTGRTIPIKVAAAYKSLKNDPHQWKHLCIEEPFDRTNTARSVYDRASFEKIVGIFSISYERLQASRNLESIFTPIPDPDIRAISSVLIR